MTSVVGFDIGNLASKIGAARNRGIDILINEVSNRATPSLVAYGPRSRFIGESAKGQEMGNFKNTVGNLKRLIGRSLNDSDVDYERKFINAELVDVEGSVGVRVNYLNEPTVFSVTQLYGAYLGQLRDIAAKELKSAINDIVIAVPVWYTDAQRRAVLDAAEIANLHPLRLINETTAIALGYGITKTDLPPPEEKPKNIAFVDIGHSNYSVTIVAFSKGQLTVKATAYDRHFGGRDIDFALVDHFSEQFKEKYKIDVKSNKKAVFRLLTAVERMKKILSANASAPLSVESIMNDVDASSSMTREDFESLISGLLDRTTKPLEEALAASELTKEDIEAVELIGGSTRIPSLKSRIQTFFGRPLSFTCNQEEAVARGATLACAILSPVFKVRDFSMHDITNFPISFVWEKAPEDVDDETTLKVFDVGSQVPSKPKTITFYRKKPFSVIAQYSEPSKLPGDVDPFIGKFDIKDVVPTPKGDVSAVRLRVQLDAHGILVSDGAAIVEEIEVEVPVETEKDKDKMQVDGEAPAPTNGEAAPVQMQKKKKTIRKELPMVSTIGRRTLSSQVVGEMKQKEGEMHSNDKLVAETEDRKNALEEYIYDTRSKLDGAYSSFGTSQEKETLQAQLGEAENWLYSEEGEDATKSAYVSKLDSLRKIGDVIAFRYKETEDRNKAVRELGEVLTGFEEKATSGDEKYAHIDPADIQKVIENVANAKKWLQDNVAKQAERRKDQDPVFTIKEIQKKRDDVTYVVTPILSKPKPKVEPPKTEEKKDTPTPPPKEGEAEATPEVEMKDANEGDKAAKADMDVD